MYVPESITINKVIYGISDSNFYVQLTKKIKKRFAKMFSLAMFNPKSPVQYLYFCITCTKAGYTKVVVKK